MVKRTIFKRPGHFISADECGFFKHEHVGRYCISTIGDWRPHGPNVRKEAVGYKYDGGTPMPAFYETAVFDVRAKASRWHAVVMHRAMTEEESAAQHESEVGNYLSICARSERRKAKEESERETVAPPKAKVGVRTRTRRKG